MMSAAIGSANDNGAHNVLLFSVRISFIKLFDYLTLNVDLEMRNTDAAPKAVRNQVNNVASKAWTGGEHDLSILIANIVAGMK